MIDVFPFQVLPVIQASSSQLFFTDLEAERPHEPEFCLKSQARSADVPRVLGNFRLVQHNVKGRIVFHQENGVEIRRGTRVRRW